MSRHPLPARRPMTLFEDEHTDARMRATIPRFTLLGAAAVVATAPFVVPTTARRLTVVGLAAVAAASALLLRRTHLIARITHHALLALLAGYCILIALAVAAAGDVGSPYRAAFLVPVLFSAVFFTGPERYGIAALAPVLEHLVAGWALPLDATGTAVRVVVFLFVAHFGVVVSDTLRDSLRSSRALHTVLEAASGSPLTADLASIGLDAARTVLGWSLGAVLLPEGDRFRVAARRRAADDSVDDDEQSWTTSASLVEVVRSKRPVFVDDLRTSPLEAPALPGARSLAMLPLVHRDEAVGALVLGDPRPRRVDGVTRERLDRLASQLALALSSASALRHETELSARLRELNRRKDDFLANVSHELRTPAATIKLVAATLRASGDRLTRDQLTEMYATLERRASHLAELIEGLLEQAVAEAGLRRLTLSTIDWRDALMRWVELAQLQTGREVTLRLPPSPVIGTGDAVKLERVVANLLSNAAKFSDPSTPIEVRLDADADTVAVVVEDRGIGIPTEERERIFDRFHQVEAGLTRSTGGVGIGLSLVRTFVDAHGGAVEVDSEPGRGARFTVRVPRMQPPRDPGTSTAPPL